MGLIDLFLLPAAVVLATAGLFVRNRSYVIFIVSSFICCSIPPVASIWDINDRLTAGDVSGVMDIYPCMEKIFVTVLCIVTIVNVTTAFRNRNR